MIHKASVYDLPGYLDVPLSRHKWLVPCDVEITGYDCSFCGINIRGINLLMELTFANFPFSKILQS